MLRPDQGREVLQLRHEAVEGVALRRGLDAVGLEAERVRLVVERLAVGVDLQAGRRRRRPGPRRTRARRTAALQQPGLVGGVEDGARPAGSRVAVVDRRQERARVDLDLGTGQVDGAVAGDQQLGWGAEVGTLGHEAAAGAQPHDRLVGPGGVGDAPGGLVRDVDLLRAAGGGQAGHHGQQEQGEPARHHAILDGGDRLPVPEMAVHKAFTRR